MREIRSRRVVARVTSSVSIQGLKAQNAGASRPIPSTPFDWHPGQLPARSSVSYVAWYTIYELGLPRKANCLCYKVNNLRCKVWEDGGSCTSGNRNRAP